MLHASITEIDWDKELTAAHRLCCIHSSAEIRCSSVEILNTQLKYLLSRLQFCVLRHCSGLSSAWGLLQNFSEGLDLSCIWEKTNLIKFPRIRIKKQRQNPALKWRSELRHQSLYQSKEMQLGYRNFCFWLPCQNAVYLFDFIIKCYY